MRKILFLQLYILFSIYLQAKSPHLFSYQSQVRNTSGQIVANQLVDMTITIHKDSVKGKLMYSETQQPMTNSFGLVNTTIGNQVGFDTIPWKSGHYYITSSTTINGSTAIAGSCRLMSVPYALYANTTDSLTVPAISPIALNALQTAVEDTLGNLQNKVYTGGLMGDNGISTCIMTNTDLSCGKKRNNTILVPDSLILMYNYTKIYTETSGGTETEKDGNSYVFKIYKVYDYTRKPYAKSYKIYLDIMNGEALLTRLVVSPELPVFQWGNYTSYSIYDANLNHMGLYLISDSKIGLNMDYGSLSEIQNSSQGYINFVYANDISASGTILNDILGHQKNDTTGMCTYVNLNVQNVGALESNYMVNIYNCNRKINIVPALNLHLKPGEAKNMAIEIRLDETEKKYFGSLNFLVVLSDQMGTTYDSLQCYFGRNL